MKTGTKVGLAALIGLGLWQGIGFLRKASKIKDNIYVKTALDKFTIVNISKVNAYIDASLTNYTGFSLTVKNVFSKLFLVEKDGNRIEAGLTSVNPVLEFKNNETKNFPIIISLPYLTIIGKLLTGKIKAVQVITYYDYKGQQIPYTSEIDLTVFTDKAKAMVTSLKKLGIGLI